VMRALTLVLAVWLLACAHASPLGRGFGDDVDWVSYEDGLKQAKESGKPLLVLLHASWCGACRALKPKIEKSAEFKELVKQFVAVNAQNDESPHDLPEYKIDGGYVPRIIFANSNGDLLRDYINREGNPQYKYFYSTAEPLLASMKQVLKDQKKDLS